MSTPINCCHDAAAKARVCKLTGKVLLSRDYKGPRFPVFRIEAQYVVGRVAERGPITSGESPIGLVQEPLYLTLNAVTGHGAAIMSRANLAVNQIGRRTLGSAASNDTILSKSLDRFSIQAELL